MATLSLTIPDNVVPRIRTAFGRFTGEPPIWTAATAAEIEAMLKNYIRSHVENYEARIAAEAKHKEVEGESW